MHRDFDSGGISIGVALGITFGMLLDNIVIGIALGISLGTDIGVGLDHKNRNMEVLLWIEVILKLTQKLLING